jgi:hypothetical protein
MESAMRLLLIALLGLSACSMKPTVNAVSDTGITLMATADHRQDVEDAAVAHCRRHGLVPRLTSGGYVRVVGMWDLVPSFRYECMPPPK